MIPKWAESPPIGNPLFTPEQIAEVRAITQPVKMTFAEITREALKILEEAQAPMRETLKLKRKKNVKQG